MFYARILEPNLTALPDVTVGGIRNQLLCNNIILNREYKQVAFFQK